MKRMTRVVIGGLAAIFLTAAAAATARAADDGFAAYWASFTTAMKANDMNAAADLVHYPFDLDDKHLDKKDFPQIAKALFGKKDRACLAKQKAVRDLSPDGVLSYSAFCGPALYYFAQTDGRWYLQEIGAND